MKSKYCFLRSSGNLKPNDVIYQVWVGSFLREFTKLTLVQEYCKDCGLYFEKWSCLVDSRLDEMKSKYQTNGNPLSSPFLSVSISIDKLYALILDDSFETFERDLMLTPTEKWCRFNHTIRYHQSLKSPIVTRNAYPHVRKNLSLRNRREVSNAVCSIVGIVILLMIDIIVSNIMNW